MQKPAQIQYTKNYQNFKFLNGNRETSDAHVKKLVNDPTFPNKFHTCPIVVMNDDKSRSGYLIIDGQHRYLAAKELKIPIYYIVDEDGSYDDIKNRNVNLKTWAHKNFYDYYAGQGNKSYQIISKIIQKHAITSTCVNSIFKKLTGVKKFDFNRQMRDGEINIEKHEHGIFDLFDYLIPAIKNIVSIRGLEFGRPLWTDFYLNSMVHYYVHDKNVLKRFFDKLEIYPTAAPFMKKYEATRDEILRISKWQRPKKTKFDSSDDVEE